MSKHKDKERREMVNHPRHYGGDVIYEVWKVLHAWGFVKDAYLWNAIKYIARSDKKDKQLEDLEKAKWYLNKKIELIKHPEREPK